MATEGGGRRAESGWWGSLPLVRFAPPAHAAVGSVDGTFPDSPAEPSSAPPALDAMYRRSFHRFVSIVAAAPGGLVRRLVSPSAGSLRTVF